MMELHENIDEALLLLYFSGTLGEKEKEEVENWISLSEENRKIAKQICYIHHVTDIIDTVKQIDPKQCYLFLYSYLSSILYLIKIKIMIVMSKFGLIRG